MECKQNCISPPPKLKAKGKQIHAKRWNIVNKFIYFLKKAPNFVSSKVIN